MLNYDTILFDLDGTLTDPKEGITNSILYALGKMGIPETDRNKLLVFIGPPLRESFKKYYLMDDDAATRAISFYREYFSVTGINENLLFEGVADMLAALKELGKKIQLATSKPTIYADRILERFLIKNYFDKITGSNLDGSMIEKTEVIAGALSGMGSVRAVMVGDREHDIIGARNNGIDSIAVTFGYGSREELSAAQPTYMIESISALREFLIQN